MLIRSQDKKNLYNFDCIQHINASENGAVRLSSIGLHETIGIYSTGEKAIKVLDKIQSTYQKHLFGPGGKDVLDRNHYVQPFGYIPPKVFQMPLDEEVELRERVDFFMELKEDGLNLLKEYMRRKNE